MRWKRALNSMAIIATVATTLAVLAPAPAYADHCEPTEPVVRVIRPGYEEPGDERDNPLCYVLLNYVWPRVCDDYTTLLGTCINSINPDPQEPIVIYPYNPNPGRMYCNWVKFVQTTLGQTGNCNA